MRPVPWRLLAASHADWLQLPTRTLRERNGLSFKRKLRFGQRLELDFSRVDRATFTQRRTEYHKGIEEDFFRAFRVSGTLDHTLRRGDSLWKLSHRTYRVPAWLIQSYNQGKNLTELAPGQTVTIPVVEPL